MAAQPLLPAKPLMTNTPCITLSQAGAEACLLCRQALTTLCGSTTGALAAFAVGIIHFYQGLQPSALLLAFYLTSSKAGPASISL